jgi:hypothetical protein
MLSKRGIDKLEKIMLANKKYYNQLTFGAVTECGTELCGAGFCRFMKIGKRKFRAEAKASKGDSAVFGTQCEIDGVELLGIQATPSVLKNPVQIFDKPNKWPEDLRAAWEETKTPTQRVRLYIKMLRTRVNDDGSIRE